MLHVISNIHTTARVWSVLVERNTDKLICSQLVFGFFLISFVLIKSLCHIDKTSDSYYRVLMFFFFSAGSMIKQTCYQHVNSKWNFIKFLCCTFAQDLNLIHWIQETIKIRIGMVYQLWILSGPNKWLNIKFLFVAP